MPKLVGNKGEWSEIYVFLRLLDIKRLYAADENLNRLNQSYYNIMDILRSEPVGDLVFSIDHREDLIRVVRANDREVLMEIPCSTFKREADNLYAKLVGNVKGAFPVLNTEEFLGTIKVEKLKAKSIDKSDIRMRIHDINSGFETVQGFSIKSRLGNPSTLINAGRTTNFVFSVNGDMDDQKMIDFNTCSKKLSERFSVLDSYGCSIEFVGMENSIFEGNLSLIDGDLPLICAHMLKNYYTLGIASIADAIDIISSQNPMDYNLINGHNFYEYKFKKLLIESALGMVPSKVWNGTADATGGYIIVREDGEVLCYHLFNRNEFESYLLKNTRFETGSTSRHGFGKIYHDEDGFKIKLNLQVRFLK